MPDLWMDVDAALSEVPVNILPLLDDTDFKTRETAVAYNAAGMDLVWNFITTAGAYTQTAVTPTTAGNYDWVHQGDGMYSIEIPASGGASINNDTEGFGWFTGLVTGVLPWRGPIIGFRAAALNNSMIDGTTIDVNVTAMAAGVITATVVADNAIDDAALAADVDTYQAKVWMVDDDGGTTDRYIVSWFKNGQPILAGITSPTIQVIKVADGADLIASTAMTEIASLQMYRYNAVTTARLTDGVAYIVKVTCTLAAATRTWTQPIGRDSS